MNDGGMIETTSGSHAFVVPLDEYEKTMEEEKARKLEENAPVLAPIPGVFNWLTPENRIRFYSILGAIGVILLTLNKITDTQWQTVIQIADQVWIILAIGSQFLASIHVKPRT